MAGYSGTVKSTFVRRPWPINLPTPDTAHRAKAPYEFVVHAAQLVGYDALASPDYRDFTLYVAPQNEVIDAVFLVDDVGLDPSESDYNTLDIRDSTTSTTICEVVTQRGVLAGIPLEITRAAAAANRAVSTGDSVALRVTGTGNGHAINGETLVFVVSHLA